jgi:hypothetical protein
MSTEKLSMRRELLETIEKSWRVPNGYPKKVSEKAEEMIINGLHELREALARPGTSVALLPLPETRHSVMGEPSTAAYTAEQMQAYALANVETRVVAWHFHRDARDKGTFGLNWPEVNRIIREEKKALNAANTITESEPGTLTPMTIEDVISMLSKTLIRVSRLESAVEHEQRKNTELEKMIQIMTPERDTYKASSEALEDQWGESRRELARLEAHFDQQGETLTSLRKVLDAGDPDWRDKCLPLLEELVAPSTEPARAPRQPMEALDGAGAFGSRYLKSAELLDSLLSRQSGKAPEVAFKPWSEQTKSMALVEAGRSCSDQHAALLAQVERLKDPEVVLVNMLRGSIAKPSVRSISMLYGEVLNGDDAQLLEIAKLRAYSGELKELLNHWLQLSNVCDENLSELAVETASVLNALELPPVLNMAAERVQQPNNVNGGSNNGQ